MNGENWLPTEKNVADYKLYTKMLAALAKEVRELSRKKQEGTLNLTKVRMINRVLRPLKEEILAQVPASIFLDLLDEDTLPNNSDAVLIITQFEAAIKEFRSSYYLSYSAGYNTHYYWSTQEHPNGREDDDEDEDEEDD